MEKVSIAGLDKAEVLMVLYNHSHPVGMGFFQALPGDMTLEEAKKEFANGDDHDRMFGPLVSSRGQYFDYLRGRPLKLNLSEDTFDPRLYDGDNGGSGTAARLIKELRDSKSRSDGEGQRDPAS